VFLLAQFVPTLGLSTRTAPGTRVPFLCSEEGVSALGPTFCLSFFPTPLVSMSGLSSLPRFASPLDVGYET